MELLDKYVSDAKWLLQQIELKMTLSNGGRLEYYFITEEGVPSIREQKEIFFWLKDMGVLTQLWSEKESPGILDLAATFNNKRRTIGFTFEVDTDMFNEVYTTLTSEEGLSSKETLEQIKTLAKSKPLPQSDLPEQHIPKPPRIDEEKRIVVYNGKFTEPIPGNQWILCKAIFDKQEAGDWVLENDVIHLFSSENKQSFPDARRLLNKRIEKELGIADFVEYNNSKARINPDIFQNLTNS